MEWAQDSFVDGVLDIRANSWRGFVEYAQNQLSDYRAYIYRGQREPWELLSKMDRVIHSKRTEASKEHLKRVLRQVGVLQEFKLACRGRRSAPARDLEEDDWWALGRHYGLETPLLDWTESPFVAAFYAFAEAKAEEQCKTPRMVYGIHRQKVEEKSREIRQMRPGTILGGTEAIEIVSPQVDDNSRLVSQRGLFTKGLQLDLEIERWVRKCFGGAGNNTVIMIKVSIAEQPGERESFLRFLNRMNINYLSLFPDLDGAARHCNMILEIDEY
jgi:hypothetical protein